jgi:hypothetical protein
VKHQLVALETATLSFVLYFCDEFFLAKVFDSSKLAHGNYCREGVESES